ncbi:MAG: type II toxin-antitoxin system PemK/MazF family toxin [Sporichthyaceae bacterium]
MDVVSRGELWWVDFAAPAGSGPGYRRPALVVSSDRFNRSRIATVIVAAVTSNLRLAQAPGNVSLPHGLLPKASVINVSQLLTVDRTLLDSHIATAPPASVRAVEAGLRLVLGL